MFVSCAGSTHTVSGNSFPPETNQKAVRPETDAGDDHM